MPTFEVEILIRQTHRIRVKADSADAALDKVLGDMDYSREPEDSYQEHSVHEVPANARSLAELTKEK